MFVHLELGYRTGVTNDIDSALSKGWNEASEWWIRCPGVQSWWKNDMVGGFTRNFSEYVNKTIEKVNNEDPEIFKRQINFLERAGED